MTATINPTGGIDSDGPPVDNISIYNDVDFDTPIYIKIYRSRMRMSLAITVDGEPFQPRFERLPEDYYRISEEIELK